MSVENEIQKLEVNLQNCYTAVANNNGTVPQDHQNFDNLSTAINTITTGVIADVDEINGENV